MISEKSKKAIDSLSLNELREEVLKDSSSRFQGEKYDYLVAKFARLKDDKKDAEHRENVATSAEANRIAEKANGLSKIAIWLAFFAFLISLFTFSHTVRTKISNKSTQLPQQSGVINE